MWSFFIQSIANHSSSAFIHPVEDHSLLDIGFSVTGGDIMLGQQRRED
jgi:hypothetical protein